MTTAAKGVTLVELLMVVAISAILMGILFPSFNHLLQRNQATIAINWIIGSIHFARHSAIIRRSMVTICPSKNGLNCGGKWHDGTIIFMDANADAKVNGPDEILRRSEFPVEGATLTWRAFRNRQYLQMTSMGYTNFMNGNFTYCSEDQNPNYSRQIVINMTGRVRKAYDVDNDGVIEDYRGRPLRC